MKPFLLPITTGTLLLALLMPSLCQAQTGPKEPSAPDATALLQQALGEIEYLAAPDKGCSHAAAIRNLANVIADLIRNDRVRDSTSVVGVLSRVNQMIRDCETRGGPLTKDEPGVTVSWIPSRDSAIAPLLRHQLDLQTRGQGANALKPDEQALLNALKEKYPDWYAFYENNPNDALLFWTAEPDEQDALMQQFTTSGHKAASAEEIRQEMGGITDGDLLKLQERWMKQAGVREEGV